MIEILYENNDLLIAKKPPFLPVEKDKTGNPDMLSLLSEQTGISLYLIHRLDLPVGGLLVFAKNKKSAAILSALVADGKIEKMYFAIVEGNPNPLDTFSDYLKKEKDRASVAQKTDKDAKYAELSYRLLSTGVYDDLPVSLVCISLKTGRFHQIRAQFSSRHMPLVGDGKYKSRRSHAPLALYCYSLSLVYHGETIRVLSYPDTTSLPFSLFSSECYQK